MPTRLRRGASFATSVRNSVNVFVDSAGRGRVLGHDARLRRLGLLADWMPPRIACYASNMSEAAISRQAMPIAEDGWSISRLDGIPSKA